MLSRFGDPHASLAPTGFIGPHGMCADSRGDLYVGEVSWTLWPGAFPGRAAAREPCCAASASSKSPADRRGSKVGRRWARSACRSTAARSDQLCDDGQEPRIRRLAQYVDAKVGEFVADVGQVGEARLLLLAALVIADELSDANDALQQERSRGRAAELPPERAARGAWSERVESIAARSQTP